MQALGRFSRILQRLLETGAAVFMVLILILISAEVISRYVFNSSHGFMEEFSKWSQIWLAYLIVGVVQKRRGHIANDMLPTRIPPSYRTLLLLASDAMTLLLALFLFWAGIQAVQMNYDLGLRSLTTVPTPMWIVRLCVPLGGLFLAFFAIEHLIGDVLSIGRQRRPGGKYRCLPSE